GTVTVTATSIYDSTKSVSGIIAIMPIAITLKVLTLTVPVRTTSSITATVTYDAFDAGVNWNAPSCATSGQCGSIAPLQTASGVAATYTAPDSIPSGGTVTITAQSVTDPSRTAALTLTIVPPPPIAVSVIPATSMEQPGGEVVLTANVANDFTNQGVT